MKQRDLLCEQPLTPTGLNNLESDSDSGAEASDSDSDESISQPRLLTTSEKTKMQRLQAKATPGERQDISQLPYKELQINQLFAAHTREEESPVMSSLTSSLLEDKESAKEQERRIRQASPFGQLKSWNLLRVIVKANDEVRQEQFAV